MTTPVTLSDDVTRVGLYRRISHYLILYVQSLSRIGIRFTMRPSECTHWFFSWYGQKGFSARWLSRHLFWKKSGRWNLLRQNYSISFILTFLFLLNSNHISDAAEEKHLLQDSKNERKYNFELSDALQRAKAVGGRLFDKNILYVLPKIPLDVKLLKNVVSAGGGQVNNPSLHFCALGLYSLLLGLDYHANHPYTQRKWKSTRHIVPSWCFRPLAENGYNICSPELLLTGALRQEIDWEGWYEWSTQIFLIDD